MKTKSNETEMETKRKRVLGQIKRRYHCNDTHKILVHFKLTGLQNVTSEMYI